MMYSYEQLGGPNSCPVCTGHVVVIIPMEGHSGPSEGIYVDPSYPTNPNPFA